MKRRNPTLQQRPARQRGVGMLEVLITFFVLAIGLMGLAGLQIKSLQFNQAAYQRSQATVAAYDILERMRLNRPTAKGNGYNVNYGGTGGSGTAGTDIAAWQSFLSTTLPTGEGQISCASNVCTIKIRWDDRFSTTAGAKEELTVTSKF